MQPAAKRVRVRELERAEPTHWDRNRNSRIAVVPESESQAFIERVVTLGLTCYESVGARNERRVAYHALVRVAVLEILRWRGEVVDWSVKLSPYIPS